MKSKCIKIYKALFSLRDLISFLSGIIVSGYVVEMTLISQRTCYHWGVFFSGLIFGLMSYVLIQISKSFSENVTAFKTNQPDRTRVDHEESAWQSINRNIPENKFFCMLPKILMPIVSFSLPIFFILGVCCLIQGNTEVMKINENKKQQEYEYLINKLDSINIFRHESLRIELNLYKDSLRTKVEK